MKSSRLVTIDIHYMQKIVGLRLYHQFFKIDKVSSRMLYEVYLDAIKSREQKLSLRITAKKGSCPKHQLRQNIVPYRLGIV